MSIGIYGYPSNPSSGGSSGGNTYYAGAGLTATNNPDGTVTFSASGSFVTYYYEPSIANSRALTAGNNVNISTAIDGQLVISAAATGGGAPTVSSYIVGTTEASLPNSSVATEGNGITIAVTPGGAATFGVSTAITGADILTWQPGDTIFTDRRALILGSGLSADFGSNTLTLNVTGQNAGTVTSVDLAVPSFLTLSGNPITTAGTITIGLASQSASTLLIAPTGGAGTPTFRRILGQDLPIFAGSNVSIVTNSSGGLVISSTASSGGSGSVTSVGLALPTDTFTISNSPVTGTGTLTGTYASQAANAFLGGPSGGFGTPLWRKLVGLDLPISAGSNIVLSTDATGGLSISSVASGGGGGTVTSVNSTTPTSLFTVSGNPITLSGTLAYALTPAACSLVWAGPVSGADANPSYRFLVAGDIPTLPFTKISGTVPIAQGGTNLTATPANGQLLIGNGTDYTLATITPGTGVQVSNGAGTITVSATGALGGTVTSVAQSVPTSLLSISGSPITTAGTLAIGLTNAASATFWRGPTSGADGTPSYGAIVATDLPTGIPAINIGAGSVDNTEFGYLDGVTSAIQTQFSNKQPLDATLTALAAYNTNGILTQTAADTFTGRTLTGTANEITVTNGDGVSGNPTFSLPTGIDATKIADGSVTSTEFQYINTLSSNAQTQIDGKAANTEAFLTLGTTSGLTSERNFTVAGGLTQQDNGAGGTFVVSASALQPLDATLTALAAYNTTGFITQTGVDTFAGRTLAVAGGLTIQEAGSVITISASGVTGGGGGFTANTITTNATAAVSNSYFVDLSSGNVTLALPTAVSQGGKEIKVKIIANTVPPNTLTLNATATNGSGTIDGSASTITSQYTYDAWTFQSANGSAWYIF